MNIKQDFTSDFVVEKIRNDKQLLLSHGFGDELIIDKAGAEQLIKVLERFVNEQQAKTSD